MESTDTLVQEPTDEALAADTTPRPLAPPIESRFLFVDIAAMRAKQLRRGALPRLDDEHVASLRVIPHKPERIAMEEVRRNLVLYETPATKKTDPAEP